MMTKDQLLKHDGAADDLFPEARNFSLVLGGPLYQLFRKAHRDDDVTSHLKLRIAGPDPALDLPNRHLGALRGAGDIQSLAGLGNVYAVIEDMRPDPFGRDLPVQSVF